MKASPPCNTRDHTFAMWPCLNSPQELEEVALYEALANWAGCPADIEQIRGMLHGHKKEVRYERTSLRNL